MLPQSNPSRLSPRQLGGARGLTSAPLLITLSVMLTLGGVAAGALMRAGSIAPADAIAVRNDVAPQNSVSQNDMSQLRTSLRHIQDLIARANPASAGSQVPLARLRLNPFRPTPITMLDGSTLRPSSSTVADRSEPRARQ